MIHAALQHIQGKPKRSVQLVGRKYVKVAYLIIIVTEVITRYVLKH